MFREKLSRQELIKEFDVSVKEAEALAILEELVQVPDLVREPRFWIDTRELLLRLAEDDIQIAKNLAGEVASARE